MVCNSYLNGVGMGKSHSLTSSPLCESRCDRTVLSASKLHTRHNQSPGAWVLFWVPGPPSQLTLVLGRIQFLVEEWGGGRCFWVCCWEPSHPCHLAPSNTKPAMEDLPWVKSQLMLRISSCRMAAVSFSAHRGAAQSLLPFLEPAVLLQPREW